MIIQHNLLAMNSDRQFKINTGKTVKVAEKLSSGYRINRSADDAAGLAISEKMRRQIRGLTQASANAQEGISMVQSAEGAMNEVHAMLHRGTELAVKAANGTLTDKDRMMIDAEIQQLKDAIDQTADHTVFNEMSLFPADGTSPRTMGNREVYHYEISYRVSDGKILVGSENADATENVVTGADALTESELADAIANELIPNAVAQIFQAFPSLKNATGSDTIDMALDISFLDGPGGTLAYAQYAYGSTGKPVNMLVKVDTSDFDDEDVLGSGENAEMLESTIAHELMHSVMQYNLTDGMSGRTGEEFPDWFVEGTAQLTGGGFPTGWNSYLSSAAETLAGAEDTGADAAIANYLKSYTVEGRPYGHGYLASAYIGYLANINNGGSTAVTGENIARGMDRVFSDLLSGDSFSDAIANNTGKTPEEIRNLFRNPDSSLTEFVRKLSYASKGGAGSVIAGSLGAGSTNILGNAAATQAFRIDPNKVSVNTSSGGKSINLQVGAEVGIQIGVNLFQMSTAALGLENTSVTTSTEADNAITEFKNAIGYVSNVRSYYGSIQNRLEHTINNLDNVVENVTAAESAIRDTDMAKLMVEYSNQNILLQAGQAILAQTNHHNEGVLTLIRG